MNQEKMNQQSTQSTFSNWVVGIGASAGGLEALVQFVSHIPTAFQGSVIVAQHLAPHAKSMMVELLSRQSTLPVVQVEDGMKLKPGTVYVVPPNHDLDLVRSNLKLTVAEDAVRPKPSVDEFFESLARAYGTRCVGIILSGTGSDGARGIEAINAAGGITLAQDDQSAKYDGMPKSAVDTGKVDSILPPEILAKNLMFIIAERENREAAKGLDPRGLQPIFDVIQNRLGQDFSLYKLPTIQRRVMKRMGFLGFKNYEDYTEFLHQRPGEVGELANDLLINVTSFFRDPEVFEELQSRLQVLLRRASPHQEFRAWIAGCATGEEAYTLATVLLDLQDRLRKIFPIKIFATDLDQDALLEARRGVFTEKEVQDIPIRLREKFFQQRGPDVFEPVKRVRDVLVFAHQDLSQNPPFVKLDMISCRNVMIYFDPELQRRLLEIFHYALVPSGILLLGKSESILSTPQLFETVDRKNKIFEKLNIPSLHLSPKRLGKTVPLEITVPRRNGSAPPLVDTGYRKLIRAFQLSAVIIDSDSTIIQLIGDVSPYLKFQNFRPDLRLTTLLPKGVGIEVPILIRKVQQKKAAYKSRTYRTKSGDHFSSFQITVRPFYDEDDEIDEPQDLYLVTFEPKKMKNVAPLNEPPVANDAPGRVAELEQELYASREHLQTVIEELGVTNEELQSLNEELSSTNEELQSTNEEFETTNEELQSSNEELTTLNEEVSAKSHDLRMLTVVMQNIQNSLGSALVVLDPQLRIQQFNDDARSVFYITEADIGRDITRVSARFEIADFESRLKKVLATGQADESVCESQDKVFQFRIYPSFDENHKNVGVILVFIDNTDIIRAQQKLAASEEKTRAIIEASPMLISLKDNLGRYLIVNSAFKNFFKLQGDVVGKTDRDLFDEATASLLRNADLEIFMTRQSIRREDVIENGGVFGGVLLANRFPLMDSGGKVPQAVGTIALDMTAQIKVQENLQKSEMLYRAIAEDQAVLVARHRQDGSLSYVNDAFTRYFGVNQQALTARSFLDFIDPQDRSSAEQTLSLISLQEPVAHFENRVSRWNNERRWVRWVHKGIFDAQSALIEIQSVGFDVTEYRNQTDRLKEKEAVFAGIFDNTSDYISLFRVDHGNLLLESMNRSAEGALGIAGQQMIGRPLQEFFSRDQGSDLVERYQKAVQSKKPTVFEEEIVFAGGTRHFLTTLVPIPDHEGNIERVAALSRDISTYKVIENDLRHAKDTADVANRAKSDFLASMSHELRTPLNVVLGFSQMLELSQLDPEQRNLVGGIHRSGQLLLTLIEDILDISKIEAGKIHFESISFSIQDLVNEVSDLFRSQAAEKGLQLSAAISERAQKNVIGDPNRLRQVMVNFIGNAIKFTSRGSIQIAVDRDDRQTDGVGHFLFSVTDTGLGIKLTDQPKIFQKFSQADSGHARRFGGSGLGLAISKQLVLLMDGEIGFESKIGEGSRFWFQLPLTLTSRASKLRMLDHQPKTLVAHDQRRLNILVVDDSIDSRTVAELFLKRLGHDCEMAGSGAHALNLLHAKAFDLILMDMQMPEMDGCETTRIIRQNKNNAIPIIALTANALTEDVERCYAAGMNDYLSKPVRIEDLKFLLNKWSTRIAKSSPEENFDGCDSQ